MLRVRVGASKTRAFIVGGWFGVDVDVAIVAL